MTPLRIALTGNVASGKSQVARIWREAGVPVVSADELSRQVTEPGSEGLDALVEAFGEGILGDDGTLDRDRMRERVFRDPRERERLEAILHPRIREARARWEEEARRGSALTVSEIPLLFEAGLEGEFDVVVFVDAPTELRRRRLLTRPGVDHGQASRIMASQMDPSKKRPRAHHVLMNDGTLEELRERSLALLERLREEVAE